MSGNNSNQPENEMIELNEEDLEQVTGAHGGHHHHDEHHHHHHCEHHEHHSRHYCCSCNSYYRD